MAKQKNLREELKNYRFQFDLLQKIPCTKEQNKTYKEILKNGGSLPNGVYNYVYENDGVSTDEFYTVCEAELTEDEKQEYLTYKKLSFLRTIKNCAIFFTALTVIALVLAIA